MKVVFTLWKIIENEKLQKVIEFCNQAWNITNSAHEFFQKCASFCQHYRHLAAAQKVSISDLFHKMLRMQNLSRDGHGKLRNAYGKVMGKQFQSMLEPCSRKSHKNTMLYSIVMISKYPGRVGHVCP